MPVLLAKRFSAPIQDFDSEIRKRLLRAGASSFLYIVPTKRKVRELQREFLSHVSNGIAPSFSLYTLETMAGELYSLLGLQRQFVSGPMQAVLMQEAIRSVESSLQYFRTRQSGRWIPQGTFQKIINVINHLRERGVYTSGLYAEVAACDPEERPKLQDILAIAGAYEKKLGETYIDAAGVMKEVNLRWHPGTSAGLFSRRFKECKTLFLSGFDEFSDPELTMIHHLSDIPALETVIAFDYHLENDDIFGHLKDNYRKLLAMGFEKRRTGDDEKKLFQEYIAAQMFHGHTRQPLQCRETVTLLAANDREHEVELVAKTIKHLMREDPSLDLSRICVSMVRPELYTAMFREVFERYGIPANITDRFHLHHSPLVVAILSLLEMQVRNFRLSDIMRSLSTPYLKIAHEEGAIDAGNLYTTAVKLKISSGRANWFDRIAGEIALLEERLKSPEDEIEEERLRREITMLLKARTDLTHLVSLMQRFQGPMSPQDFRSRLVALLSELNVVDRMIAVPGIGLSHLENDTRAYQAFVSFVDEFFNVLLLELKEDRERPFSFYLDRLRLALAQVRYNVRQKYGFGVYVTSFDETRGLSFDVMFIAGLVDGEFPPSYAPEVLFSSSRQREYEDRHLRKHRYLFYQALTNFCRHVYLSFPVREGDLELVPSSFIDALSSVVELEDCRGALPGYLRDGIYSHDEMLKFLGAVPPGGLTAEQNAQMTKPLRADLDHMHRAIGIESTRMSRTPEPEFNGTIGHVLSPEARTALDRYRTHVYSPTQLERYGKCPFSFFAERILRLDVIEQFDDGLSSLERGTVLHEILFEFYTSRRDRNLPPMHHLGEPKFQEALNELLHIARGKLDRMTASGVFWDVDKEMILGGGAKKGILHEFLDAERERKFETAPSFFEVAFGAAGSSKQSDQRLGMIPPVSLGNVLLRGRVDRVDTGDGMFTIIDYKSGSRAMKRKDIESGISLQIPLYLYAIGQILAKPGGGSPVGVAGIYYTLKPPVREQLGIGNKEFLGKAFDAAVHNRQLTNNDEELRSVIRQAIAFVNEYVDSIVRGEFPVAPKEAQTVCLHCDYSTMCRIQLQQATERGT